MEAELKTVGLHGLVNNAGIVIAGPLEFVPIDALRSQLEINVIGQVAVTQALLPLLRRSRGRIINMSSVSGRVATPFLGPYAASKFALEALSDSMRLELMPWGIHVSVIEPGPISTPIWKKSMEVTKIMIDKLPPSAKVLYGPAIEAALRWEHDIKQSMSSPKVVVRAVEHALMASKPRTRYRIGINGFVTDIFARFGSDRLKDWVIKNQRKY
jgi:NAD(P)-dependent dehydrogenase (short-subunit alcohol dehydrogenase family)